MSTASSSLRGIPPLTPLEQVGPRGYLRYNFLIALPADYDPDDVLRVLRAGWKAIANRIPELACELVPDTTPATTPTQQQQQAGLMKLQKITGDYEPLTARDLRSPELFPDSYEELRARHFPLSAFRDALFARRDTWPAAGDRLPVAAMQANFLRGGLALQCCFVHVVGDWNSFCTWLEAWAEECRRVQGEAISHPVDVSDAIFADREKIMRASGNNPGRPEDHPELTVLPFTPTGAPPKMLSKAHRGQVFYLSPEARVALKEDASPRNATSANTTITQAQAYISTNDAVVALIWRAVMGAQHPLETLEGDPVSVCNVAIDGRLRTDPAVHPRTLGNFLTWTAATLPIRSMLDGSTNIADVALAIRRALGPVGPQWVDDVTTLVENLEDVSRLVATAFLDAPGKNCAQTSWIQYSPYEFSWGEKVFGGNKIEAVRTLDVGIINGGQAVLPRLPDGGIEFIVGVEESCLPRLLEDPLLARYVQAR